MRWSYMKASEFDEKFDDDVDILEDLDIIEIMAK